MMRKNLTSGTLILSLIALPFSIPVCHFALIIFLLLWATEGGWDKKLMIIRKNILIWLILAFMVLQFAGLLYTENLSNGWFTIEKKLFFFVVPIALATSSVTFDETDILRIFNFFIVACFVGTIICLAHSIHQLELLNAGIISGDNHSFVQSSYLKDQDLFTLDKWLLFSYVELAKGINIHPTYLSLYLAFCVVVILYQLFSGHHKGTTWKIVSWVLTFYFTVFIVSLSSRIVILSVVIILSFTLARQLMSRIHRPKVIFIVMVFLITTLTITLYINPVSRYRNLVEFQSSSLTIQPETNYKTATEIRASLWWLAYKSLSKTNILWGAGSGDVNDIMQQLAAEYKITNVMGTYNTHNEFLYITLGNGITGLIIFILLLALPFWTAWINQNYLTLAFLFIFGMSCLTETTFELQKGIIFFSLVFTLLTVKQALQTEQVPLNFFNARN